MLCPLCGSNLELKQINFTTAVFICVDLKCPYPVGTECIQVERNYQDMIQISQKHSKSKVHKSPKSGMPSVRNVNETERLFSPSNVPQSCESSNLISEKMLHNNQTIEDVNLEHGNFDLSHVEDLDGFISGLLK